MCPWHLVQKQLLMQLPFLIILAEAAISHPTSILPVFKIGLHILFRQQCTAMEDIFILAPPCIKEGSDNEIWVYVRCVFQGYVCKVCVPRHTCDDQGFSSHFEQQRDLEVGNEVLRMMKRHHEWLLISHPWLWGHQTRPNHPYQDLSCVREKYTSISFKLLLLFLMQPNTILMNMIIHKPMDKSGVVVGLIIFWPSKNPRNCMLLWNIYFQLC